MTARVLTYQVDACVFDLDGTLLDSERAITEAAAAAFLDVGVQVAPHQIADHLGAPLQELYAIFVGDSDEARMRRYVTRYIALHDEHPDRFPAPLPGVREALASLRARGLPLAVATTKPTARAREQLAGCGLDAAFEHIQGTDPGMQPKPAPDVVLAACKALGVDAARALMIGDTVRDVRAGHAAGSKTVVVAYDDARMHVAKGFGADALIASLTAL